MTCSIRSIALAAGFALVLSVPAAPAAAGGIVIDMPAPPPAAAADDGGASGASDRPEPGAIALARYGGMRTLPLDNGSGPVFGWWGGGWYGPAWSGGPWFPRYPGPWCGGGYRIAIGHHLFARRAWNGGYVRPFWAWTAW